MTPFTEVKHAVLRLRAEFSSAGLDPPVAIELKSYIDGIRIVNSADLVEDWQRGPASNEMLLAGVRLWWASLGVLPEWAATIARGLDRADWGSSERRQCMIASELCDAKTDGKVAGLREAAEIVMAENPSPNAFWYARLIRDRADEIAKGGA